MTFLEAFNAALARAGRVATSSYLHLLRDDIALVENQMAGIPDLQRRVTKLTKPLLEENFALDPAAINVFIQDLAEAQFFALCHSLGVQLKSVPTQTGRGTPDFACLPDESTTFEVKALSIVNGERGIREDLEQALAAMIQLECQLAKGKRTAFAEHATKAYGEKVRPPSANMDHINVLLDKVRQNIKPNQYTAQRSFLVLNTTAVPVLCGGPGDLRPVYWDEQTSPHPVSGAMWMLAFGKVGMALFGHPEFEGKPGVEGHFEKEGVLNEHGCIAGIVVVRRELSGDLRVGLLARASDLSTWFDDCDQAKVIKSLVSDSWNDELDSNGWQLARDSARAQKLANP